MLLAEEEVPETLGLGLLLELLHDGDDGVPSTERGRLGQLGVVQVLGREALVLDKGNEVVELLERERGELVLDLGREVGRDATARVNSCPKGRRRARAARERTRDQAPGERISAGVG